MSTESRLIGRLHFRGGLVLSVRRAGDELRVRLSNAAGTRLPLADLTEAAPPAWHSGSDREALDAVARWAGGAARVETAGGEAPAVAESAATEVAAAVRLLREARDRLRRAGAMRAADRVAAALRSAEGAARHAAGLAVRVEAVAGLPPVRRTRRARRALARAAAAAAVGAW